MDSKSINVGAWLARLCALLGLWASFWPVLAAAEPLRLHPDNNRYFLFQGKPTVLVTSAEHYGAVINLDFDYSIYLDTLQAASFNHTRVFSGTIVEGWGSPWNTLSPPAERLLVPWARSDQPGYARGGNKFDLTRWDAAYFERLKDFVAQAGLRGIVVEVTLFSAYYNEWLHSPLNVANNINGIGNMAVGLVYNLSDPAITAVQEALTEKIVTELNAFDNVYFEICNEPYLGGVTPAWQQRIAARIRNTEALLPKQHLIAQNVANGAATISNPDPLVSIFNFHYAPPEAVSWNYGLNRPIGLDETGFRGATDTPYRKEAWKFIMAGGGAYNNLDWSFSAASESGNDFSWTKTLGGGGPSLRTQISTLARFINSFEMTRMVPGTSFIKGGTPAAAHALSEAGRQYAVWLDGGAQANLQLELPAGAYRAQWINTHTGQVLRTEDFSHAGGVRVVASPAYSEDIALSLRASQDGNLWPSVSLTSPVAGTVFPTGSTVALTATVADPDGQVVKVEFYQGSTKIGEATQSPWTLEWTAANGSYTLQAVATDNGGATSSSAPVAITMGRLETTFYRAINLNGPAQVIDGHQWEGKTAANFSYSGSAFENQSIALNPATDPARAQMIRSSIWNRAGSNVTLTNVPAGTYKVYLYVWEDNVPTSFGIAINGQSVQTGLGSGSAGQWQRLGPWTVELGAGSLTVTATPGDVNFSGIEVWRSGAEAPPGTPSALAASADSATQVSLAWTDNSGNETGFKLERKTGAGGTWVQIGSTGANVSSYRDTGLGGATTYLYRVRATNATGDSAYSNEVSVTTPAAETPPAAPSGLVATAISQTQVSLGWTDNAHNETGFKLEFKAGDGPWAPLFTVSGGVDSYQATGLLPGTRYSFRVRATNGAGDSAYSNEATTTTPGTTNNPPSASLTSPASGQQIALGTTLTLTASATDDGAVTKVEFFAAGSKIGEDASAPYSLAWLPPAAGQYTISAVATDDRGLTGTSPPVSLVVTAPATTTFYRAINLNGPAAVIDGRQWEGKTAAGVSYSGSAFENQSIALSPATDAARAQMIRSSVWNRAGSNVTLSNVPAGNYEVYLYIWEDNASATFDLSVNGQVLQRGVRSGGAGQWQKLGPWPVAVSGGTVTVRASAGDANFSGIELWRSGGDVAPTVPSAPSGLAAVADSASQVSLTWADNSGNETGFKVERKTGAGGAWAHIGTTAANVVTYRDSGLSASTPYVYRVRAANAAGDSAASGEASVTTPAVTNPPPSVVLASPGGGQQLVLGTAYTLSATASDDGAVAKVAFLADGVKIGEDATAPYTLAWTPSAAGNVVLTAVATDNLGLSATSAAVSVSVAVPGAATFYRAINLNGPAVVIDGQQWEGRTAANFSYSGSAFENQSIALSPATDAVRAQMIRSSVWNRAGSNVTLTGVPSGTYDVYLYNWEDNAAATFSVAVNGTRVQSNVSSGSKGQWRRLGPWTVVVSSGSIAVTCTAGDANLSGIEVWRRH